MQRKILPLLVMLAMIKTSTAQEVRLNGYAGYVFDDKVGTSYTNYTYFDGTVKGGFLGGLGLEYMAAGAYGVELLWMNQNTHAPLLYYDNISTKNTDFNMGINWIMLGANRYYTHNPNAEPYGGFMLGMAIVNVDNPSNGKSGSVTKFAWGIRLGGNFFPGGKSIGIKLQMNLMSAVQAVGGSVYFGTGGSGVAVSGYSSFLQFGLGGGLVFKFSGHHGKK